MADEIIEIKNLKVRYPIRSDFRSRVTGYIKAVDGINLSTKEGETYGLIGESGSDKSTTDRATAGVEEMTSGQILYKGVDVTEASNRKRLDYNKDAQMIFQNSMSSLSPKKRIEDIIAEPIKNFKNLTTDEERERVQELLGIAGMPSNVVYKYPYEFSGGQRQRIGVARTVATHPELIVADESTSALDLSVQAQILNFMKHIQQEYNIAYLSISHDLGIVRHMSENIAIMHRGRFVEIGKRDQICKNPMHIYTKRLPSAIPVVNVEHGRRHEEERQRVEKEFLQDQDRWYEKDSRVLPLQKVDDRHFVALPKEMVKQELKGGE